MSVCVFISLCVYVWVCVHLVCICVWGGLLYTLCVCMCVGVFSVYVCVGGGLGSKHRVHIHGQPFVQFRQNENIQKVKNPSGDFFFGTFSLWNRRQEYQEYQDNIHADE